MTVLTDVNRLPSLADTILVLKTPNFQCCWYLPNQKRLCKCWITNVVDESALHLAERISKSCSFTAKDLKELDKLAEEICCKCHHRNYMFGGLAQKLVDRWQVELRSASAGLGDTTAMIIKREHDIKPVTFGKHVVQDWETLTFKLLASLDPRSSKTGSLYIYTHKADAFSGFIKIGYTGHMIHGRLEDWATCGHGYPMLLESFSHVRHPERVETLTHFELLEHRYAQKWCRIHGSPHIEWFKTQVETASSIIRLWSEWMGRANPYDRRGHLTEFWKSTVQFLEDHDVPVSARVMMQVQEIEEDSTKVTEFIDDDALRKGTYSVIKQEWFD